MYEELISLKRKKGEKIYMYIPIVEKDSQIVEKDSQIAEKQKKVPHPKRLRSLDRSFD